MTKLLACYDEIKKYDTNNGKSIMIIAKIADFFVKFCDSIMNLNLLRMSMR